MTMDSARIPMEGALHPTFELAQPFAELSPEGLKELEQITVLRQLPENSTLFTEERQPAGIFIVRAGRVKLSVSSRKGRHMILQIAGSGEILGLSATLSGKPYEVTAETMTRCEVIFIPRREFVRFLRQHAEACLEITKLLSNDLDGAYERVRSLRQP